MKRATHPRRGVLRACAAIALTAASARLVQAAGIKAQ